MFRSGNMIIISTQCCTFIMESLNFKTAKPLKSGTDYSRYHMAHAEADTSSRPSLNHRHCSRLKHTP